MKAVVFGRKESFMANFKSYKHYYSNANTDKRCECCESLIKKGERYSKESGYYLGEKIKRDLCLKCDEALDKYTDATGFDYFHEYKEILAYRTA